MDTSVPVTKSDELDPTTKAMSAPAGSAVLRSRDPIPGISTDNVNIPVPGWPGLARTIANKPAFEAFPSFADLNVKSLLYYQAELILLRKALHKEEYKDYFTGEYPKNSFAEDLEDLIDGVRLQDDKPKQWELIEQIRNVLDKYNNALIQYSQISAFPDADTSNVNCLRKCAREVCGNGSCPIGPGSEVWGPLSSIHEERKSFWKLLVGLFKYQAERRDPVPKEFQEHLIVPSLASNPDRLTLWVVHSFIPMFHYVWNYCGRPTWEQLWRTLQHRLSRFRRNTGKTTADTPESEGTDFYDAGEKNLTTYTLRFNSEYITSMFTLLAACLLPVVAIIVLSRVHTMEMILGLIALFNTVFACGLVFLSPKSSRIEIFSATATFSAVMVVFVQNKLSPH